MDSYLAGLHRFQWRSTGLLLVLLTFVKEVSPVATPTGTYTYQIPISLPPSLENMAPQDLSLVYSSTGGQSLAGSGWSLNGIPMITRVRGMQYTSADRFIAAGSELVDTVGMRSMYQPEIAGGGLYYPQYGNCGLPAEEPCAWEVHMANGSKLFFGSTNNSRAIAQGKSAYRVWALDRVENAMGLYYTIDYEESGGELYPSRIIYTYGPNTSKYKRITFAYVNAPQSPLLYSFIVPTQMTRLLSEINVSIDNACIDMHVSNICVGGNNFRSYQFHYGNSPSTGKTRLESFTELDENGTTLPSSSAFTYQDNGLIAQNQHWNANTVTHIRNGGGDMRDYAVISGDFNGDGLTDVATIHKSSNGDGWASWIAMEISTGTGFRSETWTSVAAQRMYSSGGSFGNYAVVPGDFNGDGKTDIAVIRRSTTGPGDFWYDSIIVEYSNGNSFNAVTINSALPRHMYDGGGFTPDYAIIPADVNGDGISDLVTVSRSPAPPQAPGLYSVISCVGGMLVAFMDCPRTSTPVGEGSPVNIWTDNFVVLLGTPYFQMGTEVWSAATARQIYNGGGKISDYKIIPGDYNGDGRVDFVFARKGVSGDAWSNGFFVELSAGGGFISTFWPTPTANAIANSLGDVGSYAMISGDFNGDGRPDIATLQIPKTCLEIMSTCPNPQGGVAPVNDPWYSGIRVDLATGDGFVSQYWPAAAPARMWSVGTKISEFRIVTTDLNRDGMSDIVFAHGSYTGTDVWQSGFVTESSTGSGFRAGQLNTPIASYLPGTLGENPVPNYYLLSGDFNGDALTDLLFISPHGADWNNVSTALELSSGAIPDQLIAIQTVLGLREEISYRVSTKLPNAIKPKTGAIQSYPYVVAAVPQNLVERITLFGDGKTQKRVSYAYNDGKVFLASTGRHRPLGFTSITETDEISGRYKTTRYFQAPSYALQPSRTDAFRADGSVFMTEIFDNPYLQPTGDQAWFDVNPWPRSFQITRHLVYTYENGIVTLQEHRPVQANLDGVNAYEDLNNGNWTITFKKGGDDYVEEKIVCLGKYQDTPCSIGGANLATSEVMLSWEKSAYETADSRKHRKPTKKSVYLGKPDGMSRWAVTSYAYNTAGQLIRETSENNFATTEYIYDADFGQFPTYRIHRSSRPRDSSNAETVYSVTHYDPRFGKIIHTEDERGLHTVHTLDTRGRIVETSVYDNHAVMQRKTTITYSEFIGGSRIDECKHFGENFGQTTCSSIITDSFGREMLKITQAPAGADNHLQYLAIKTEYDAKWRKQRVSLPFASDANGNGMPDRWISYEYDLMDRVTKTTGPDGRATTTRFNDFDFLNCTNTSADPCIVPTGTTLRQSVTDASGRRKDTYTNHLGKPLKVIDAVGTPDEATVTYEYYANGKLKSVIAPQGTTTITYYPVNGLRSSITDPNAGTTTFYYDWLGTALGETGTGGFLKVVRELHHKAGTSLETASTVNYDYDAWGRVRLKTTQNSSQTTSTGYYYDGTEGTYGQGRLTKVVHQSPESRRANERYNNFPVQYGTERKLSYDILGNVTGVTTDISLIDGAVDPTALPAHSVTLNKFDNLGRKIEITYPDLMKSTIKYVGGTPAAEEVEHDGVRYARYSHFSDSGQPTRITHGNGTVGEYHFNAETLRLDSLTLKNARGEIIQDLTYDFDEAGNIRTIFDGVVANASYEYQYDNLHRLKRAERGDGRVLSYAFDTMGNLTLKESRQNYFTPGTTQLSRSDIATETGTESTAVEYTAHGGVSRKENGIGVTDFEYSAANMLLYAAQTGGALDGTAVVMHYDEGNQRYLKRFLPKLTGNAPTVENPEIRTWYMGGMELREKWAHTGGGMRRIDIQRSKIIFGANGERLAMIAGPVTAGQLALGIKAEYWFAKASLTNGETVGGFISVASSTVMGCYRLSVEFYSRNRFEVLLTLLLVAFCGFIGIVYFSASGERSTFGMLPRITAVAMLISFVSVNCSGGNLPGGGGGGAGGGATPWDPLLSGMPEGTYYYHANHLQSATLITNSTGEEELRIHYLPYGEIDATLSGRFNSDTGAVENPQAHAAVGAVAARYTDQELDIETNLMYYNARYYDTSLGVFTSADTVVPDSLDSQGYNRYMYVRGNPIKYSDPTGHFWWVVPVLIGIAIGGIAAGTGGDVAGWIAGTTKFDWDAAWKGAIAGALAGATGAWVGTAVAAAAPAGVSGLSVAVASGVTGGYTAGFMGGATGAWLGGAKFLDGFAMGMLGGMVGAVAGGVLSAAGYGISRGLDALDDQITSTVGSKQSGYANAELGGSLRPIGRLADDFGDYYDQYFSNGTKYPAYLQPESGDVVPIKVDPGATYKGKFDGFAMPTAKPGLLFKVQDGISLRLESDLSVKYFLTTKIGPYAIRVPQGLAEFRCLACGWQNADAFVSGALTGQAQPNWENLRRISHQFGI